MGVTPPPRGQGYYPPNEDLPDHFVGVPPLTVHTFQSTGASLAETRVVYWQDCDCEWSTKYCEENHSKSARIPLEVLRRYEVLS